MSALGHERTSQDVCVMSALPPKADISGVRLDVRFVPITEVGTICAHKLDTAVGELLPADTGPLGRQQALAGSYSHGWRFSVDEGRRAASDALTQFCRCRIATG
jgi:hypothetical protein